ncbi:hypothetical protein MSHRCOH1_03770 [Candidatus Ornithobacterium hominis]|nr:hypothetical protein MSHRCOH1_03770 [Candidatus Ornithobacterium hominis]
MKGLAICGACIRLVINENIDIYKKRIYAIIMDTEE